MRPLPGYASCLATSPDLLSKKANSTIPLNRVFSYKSLSGLDVIGSKGQTVDMQSDVTPPPHPPTHPATAAVHVRHSGAQRCFCVASDTGNMAG